MVETVLIKSDQTTLKDDITIPVFNIPNKQNIGLIFNLMCAHDHVLEFHIEKKDGEKLYSNRLNVELR